jgi:hypothetical protein
MPGKGRPSPPVEQAHSKSRQAHPAGQSVVPAATNSRSFEDEGRPHLNDCSNQHELRTLLIPIVAWLLEHPWPAALFCLLDCQIHRLSPRKFRATRPTRDPHPIQYFDPEHFRLPRAFTFQGAPC